MDLGFFVFYLTSDCNRKNCILSQKDMGPKVPQTPQWVFVVIVAEATGKRLPTMVFDFHKSFHNLKPSSLINFTNKLNYNILPAKQHLQIVEENKE